MVAFCQLFRYNRGMKIWIAGQNGLLGQACARALIGHDVVGTSRTDLDMTDPMALRAFVAEHKPSHLINCSGFTGVDKAEYAKETAHAINAQAVEQMGKLGVKVLHFSTGYVFGGTAKEPYCPGDTPAPLSVYGMTKLRGEERLLAVDPKACVIRTAWIFGHGKANFITEMMEKMQSAEVLRVVADQVSSPSYADDIAKAMVALLDSSGVHHVVNTGCASRLEWAKAILDEMEKRGIEHCCKEILPAQSREFLSDARRPAYSVLANSPGVEMRPWRDAMQAYLDQEVLCPAL